MSTLRMLGLSDNEHIDIPRGHDWRGPRDNKPGNESDTGLLSFNCSQCDAIFAISFIKGKWIASYQFTNSSCDTMQSQSKTVVTETATNPIRLMARDGKALSVRRWLTLFAWIFAFTISYMDLGSGGLAAFAGGLVVEALLLVAVPTLIAYGCSKQGKEMNTYNKVFAFTFVVCLIFAIGASNI